MVETFEVLVIGGGGAGYTAASTAARVGKQMAMAGRVSDTQHPYPTLSELVRWTADQVGKTSRSAAAPAPGVPAMQLQAC